MHVCALFIWIVLSAYLNSVQGSGRVQMFKNDFSLSLPPSPWLRLTYEVSRETALFIWMAWMPFLWNTVNSDSGAGDVFYSCCIDNMPVKIASSCWAWERDERGVPSWRHLQGAGPFQFTSAYNFQRPHSRCGSLITLLFQCSHWLPEILLGGAVFMLCHWLDGFEKPSLNHIEKLSVLPRRKER